MEFWPRRRKQEEKCIVNNRDTRQSPSAPDLYGIGSLIVSGVVVVVLLMGLLMVLMAGLVLW